MTKKKQTGGWGRNLDYAQIEQDRLAGMSHKKIAEKHGCDHLTVYDICRNKSHILPQFVWVKFEQRAYRALNIAALKHGTDIKTMASAIMADAIEDLISEEHISDEQLLLTPYELKMALKPENTDAD